jgi:hypothetical protein
LMGSASLTHPTGLPASARGCCRGLRPEKIPLETARRDVSMLVKMLTPATVLADAFFAIIEALWNSIAAEARERALYTPLTVAIAARLQRLADRFASLVARLNAGKLRVPDPARPALPRPAAAAPRTRWAPDADSRLPGAFAWMCRLFPESAVWPATALGLLLEQPEVADLVAAAPQAVRILRPLCHMLGIRPPPALALPPRPCVRTTPPEPSASSEQKPLPVDTREPLQPEREAMGFRPPNCPSAPPDAKIRVWPE